MEYWPGTTGASLFGAQSPAAAAAGVTADEGMDRLNRIMDGKTFPKWIVTTTGTRFEPDWGGESVDLCNKVIRNIYEELTMSSRDHESWKAQKKQERGYARRQGHRVRDEQQQQGWLDRRAILGQTLQDWSCGISCDQDQRHAAEGRG